MCIVWKAYQAAADYPANSCLFDATGATDTFFSRFVAASNSFNFVISGTTITGRAQTFTAGTIIVLHYVWGPGSMKLYVNGAEDATGATFDPPALGTYLYIGSENTPSEHGNDTYLGCHIYNRVLTAGEIAAEYATIYQAVTGWVTYGAPIEALPYFWTKDGDGLLDNVDDTIKGSPCDA